jgi:hypothetical protein
MKKKTALAMATPMPVSQRFRTLTPGQTHSRASPVFWVFGVFGVGEISACVAAFSCSMK